MTRANQGATLTNPVSMTTPTRVSKPVTNAVELTTSTKVRFP